MRLCLRLISNLAFTLLLCLLVVLSIWSQRRGGRLGWFPCNELPETNGIESNDPLLAHDIDAHDALKGNISEVWSPCHWWWSQGIYNQCRFKHVVLMNIVQVTAPDCPKPQEDFQRRHHQTPQVAWMEIGPDQYAIARCKIWAIMECRAANSTEIYCQKITLIPQLASHRSACNINHEVLGVSHLAACTNNVEATIYLTLHLSSDY